MKLDMQSGQGEKKGYNADKYSYSADLLISVYNKI